MILLNSEAFGLNQYYCIILEAKQVYSVIIQAALFQVKIEIIPLWHYW